MNNPYGYAVAPPQQQQQQQHAVLLPPTNIDPALESVVKSFMRSEKYGRKIKNLVRATSVPGRQNYKFAPATALTQQETRLWRNNLMQDEIASNNPFWTARWMRVFGIAPKLDDSLLKVPWIKHRSTDGDARSSAPLHRKETYLDLRDEQNRNWAMDSFTSGIDCAQKGQLEEAIKAYTQAIQIDAKCVEAYVARGCTYANMRKWRAAKADFDAALGLDPSNISAQQYRESTIAQENEHRLNPSVDVYAVDTLINPSNPTAFGGDANLDDINEIVLDTDALHNTWDLTETTVVTGAEAGAETGVPTGVEIGGTEAEVGSEPETRTTIVTQADLRVVLDPGPEAGLRVPGQSPDQGQDHRQGLSRDHGADPDPDPQAGYGRFKARGGSQYRPDIRSRDTKENERSAAGDKQGRSVSRSTSRSRKSPPPNRVQNRGRSPPPQDHAADDIKGWPKEKEAPAQEDYSPNVNYDYSPDIQYDRSPTLPHKIVPTEKRPEAKASLEVDKGILEASVKTSSIDHGESHPMKASDDIKDIKDIKAATDSKDLAALPTLKGLAVDPKKADPSEDKDRSNGAAEISGAAKISGAVGISGAAETTTERRRSRSRSKTRDRSSMTARARSRSSDRGRTGGRGRSSRSPARKRTMHHDRSRSRSGSRSRNNHSRSKETQSKDGNGSRTARSQSNGG
ncbi:hypothetical protein BGZ70_004521, partial [Mortierella alpina]